MATVQVYDEQGEALLLGARLGGGGEGDVHEVVGRPDLCAKILQPSRRTQAKFDKVHAMVSAPPAGAYDGIEGFPVLTWPRALLFTAPTGGKRAFAGYTMARVLPRDFVPFFQVTTRERRRKSGADLTWDKMVLLGMRLCHVVRTLHKFGYAVGDVNDRNVLVSRRLTPLVMDTDSFEVPRPRGGHFPSIMGDPLYWAPELLDVDFAKHTGSRVNGDRYALGVLLFQLFMNGLRPYQARGSLVDGLETLAAKTRAGHYPWAKPKRGVLEPPAGAPDYAALPAPIRLAFERCFVTGHRRPNARPTADDWYGTLAAIRPTTSSALTAPTPLPASRATPINAYVPSGPMPTSAPNRTPNPTAKTTPRTAAQQRRRTRHATPPQFVVPPEFQSLPSIAVPRRGKPGIPAAAQPRRDRRRTRQKGAGTSRPRRRAARPPGPASRNRLLQATWLLFFALACATPGLLLQVLPRDDVRVVTALGAMLLLSAAGIASAGAFLRRGPARRQGMALAIKAAWVALAAATVLAAALLGLWAWLLAATAVAAWLVGALAFGALERGTPRAFELRPRGVLHAVVALVAAHAPVLLTMALASA